MFIRPIKDALDKSNIETLVIVSDGSLRLIPFAALHDKNQFLIEQYAVVNIPAIRLTADTQDSKELNKNILLAGLSEARQGFSSLPNVKDELSHIQTIMDAEFILDNQNYTQKKLTQALTNDSYEIEDVAERQISMNFMFENSQK